MTEKEQDPRDKLVQAYNQMMERVKHALEEAEEKARPTLEHAISAAREKAVTLGEITREEAEKVGDYLKRDMEEIGEYLQDTGSELSSWFHIDMELIEARILELVASVADKTRVELAELADRAREASTYHTGEITGPGSLECTQCGEVIHFAKTGHIPPCPKCHASSYRRAMPT